jgi:hypothetical protein
MYGIEAARASLVMELEELIPGMNYAHYSVYADEMAVAGMLTSISRTGLDVREAHNVLLRTSYNYMNQVTKNAAVNGSYNEIYGISAPLMVGSVPKIGTLYNQVSIDHDFVKANTTTVEDLIDDL